jgi:hypothetical protein
MADQGGVVDFFKRAKDKAMGLFGRMERAGTRMFNPPFGPQGMGDRAKVKARRLKQAGYDALTPEQAATFKPKRSMKRLTKGR